MLRENGEVNQKTDRRVKGFYFSQIPKGGIGPRRKVMGQIRAFARAGIDLELIESPFQTEGVIRGSFLLRQIVCRLPFTFVYSRHLYRPEYEDADVCYIRYLAGDVWFSRFLRMLKKNNENIKIVMELADYPVTYYMKVSLLYRILYFPIYLKELIARKSYRKYVDRIALLSSHGENYVYGIPTLWIENGIDLDSIRKRVPAGTDEIHICAVAAMQIFHGYDRLIEGLYQYYNGGGSRMIVIHFVGGEDVAGNECQRYREMSGNYHLDDHVVFHGFLTGDDLDNVYDSCNIAAASLGMYRIGYKVANSLKVREYLAKGLPVISGGPVDLFKSHDFMYCLECPNDDTPIDVNALIAFFDQTYKSGERNVSLDIRKYAEHYCSMDQAINNVAKFFLDESVVTVQE